MKRNEVINKINSSKNDKELYKSFKSVEKYLFDNKEDSKLL